MKSIIRFPMSCLFVFSFFVLIGCTTDIPNYEPAPAIKKAGFPVNNPVFICNLIDNREPSERIPLDPDANPLILIPLWPYTYSATSPVLRYTFLQSDMLNTVKHIIAEDIRASGIFKYVTTQTFGVTNIGEAKYEAPVPPNAYIIEVTLEKAVWSRYLTSYGLSYPGTILWAFGLPVSYGSVEVSIKVDIYPPNNYVKPIVEKVISMNESCTEWVYDQVSYKPPISEFTLAEIFPDIMKQMRELCIEAVEKVKVQ